MIIGAPEETGATHTPLDLLRRPKMLAAELELPIKVGELQDRPLLLVPLPLLLLLLLLWSSDVSALPLSSCTYATTPRTTSPAAGGRQVVEWCACRLVDVSHREVDVAITSTRDCCPDAPAHRQ